MGSSRVRHYPGVIVGGLLLTGLGLGIAPAHAAVDGRCTVAATPAVTYRIATPTAVREGPADACVRVVDGKLVDATSLRPLLAAKALVAVPQATPRPAPVKPPVSAPKPPVTVPTVPASPSSPAAPAPASTAPGTPPAPTSPPPGTTDPTLPTTPPTTLPTTPATTVPPTGSAVPGAPTVPTTTSPAGTPPVAGVAPAATPVVPRSSAPTSSGITLLSPGTSSGDRLGVDLLAPLGSAPVLEGDPDAPLVAPQQAEAPETVLLRNLGESDPTGVHSGTTAEALAAQHRPGLLSAALGAAILAGLAGFAVRHRVLSRYRRRPAAASASRLVEVSVRSRPDA